MKPSLRRALGVVLGSSVVALVLLSAGIAALLVWGLPELIGTVSIDGEVIRVSDRAQTGLWLIATAVALAALLLVAVAVPAAIALGLLATTLGLVVALSPLLVAGALGVWLWRRSAAAPGPATMASPPPPR